MTSRLRRSTATLVVAVLGAACGVVGLIATAAPAGAATCGAGSGASVVVDFNDLGGGTQAVCVAGGGGTKAAALFSQAGFSLTRAQRQPGFVCRVDGVPAEDPCVNTSPADAYWGLWWSDGTSGTWTYASLGVDSLTIPEGGSVALAWDDVSGQEQPSAAPPKAAPSSSPSSSPSSGPSSNPSATPTSGSTRGPGTPGGSGPTGSSEPSGSVSAPGATEIPMGTALPYATSTAGSGGGGGRGGGGKKDRSGTQGDEETGSPDDESTAEAGSPSATPDDVTDGADARPASAGADGLPVWVAPLLVVLLAGAGVGVAVVRRRSGS